MNFIVYTPEFLIYPFLYMLGLVTCLLIVRFRPGATIAVLFIYTLFWLALYGMLTFAKSAGWLPCELISMILVGGCA